MAIYPIRTFPDSGLTMKAGDVTEFGAPLQKLADDMLETMYDAPGVGLAAPQIGISKRFFVADAGDGPFVMANPTIVDTAGKLKFEEGCLSVPGRYWMIKRPDFAVAEGFDVDGNPVTYEGDDLMGRVLQHEIDHLNGMLLLSRLSTRVRNQALTELREDPLGMRKHVLMGAVFLGTPVAAVPSLCALAQVTSVDLVITQPDRAAGRSSSRIPSPVKVAAQQFGFSIAQPTNAGELLAAVKSVQPEVGLVVAYGRILEPALLDEVPLGFLNVHFSLLPRWRGAAPVERAIAAGDETTGVTLMKIDEGLDTGPVIGERPTDIGADDTGGTLTARLSHIGARLVDDLVPQYLLGRRVPVPQINTGATHAARLTKAEAEIRPTLPALDALRRIRAFAPRPGAWVSTPEGVVRIHEVGQTVVSDCTPDHIEVIGERVILGLADGGLILEVIQPEGKPRMAADAWMHGRRGERLAVTGS